VALVLIAVIVPVNRHETHILLHVALHRRHPARLQALRRADGHVLRVRRHHRQDREGRFIFIRHPALGAGRRHNDVQRLHLMQH
jgi:hypothetical protein